MNKTQKYITLGLTISYILASMLLFSLSSRTLHVNFVRVEFLGLLYLLFLVINVFGWERTAKYIYKYRWIIYILLIGFLVLNNINFSSIGCFNDTIQPGKGSDLIYPIFGYPRAIRSDEWLVNVPRMLSGQYSSYGPLNNIVRSVTTSNISASGLQLDYASLSRPCYYGFYLLGAEYGESFFWSYSIVIGFAFWNELFLILTDRKKLLSFFGAVLIWFSCFNLWWSTCAPLMSGAAIVVLFFYFITAKKTGVRFIYGTLLAIAGADYVAPLYPAWQVPMGYIILSLMVWILVTNKNWRQFKKKDYFVFFIDVVFMISIIARYLYIELDYILAVQTTVYPGTRVDYGGMAIQKLLGYFTSLLSFLPVTSNPCEIGVIYCAFPLGLILMVYTQAKENGNNKLLWCLCVPTVILLTYCTIGLPPLLCKIILLTNSTRGRAVDFLGVLFAIELIVSLSEMEKKGFLFPLWLGGLISFGCLFAGCWYSLKIFENLEYKYLIVILTFITFIFVTIVISNVRCFNLRRKSFYICSNLLLIASFLIHPIMIGIDAITSKPVAKAVQSIVEKDPDSRWVALDGIITPNFLIACGAPTINSVNYIPNYKMWNLLDSSRKYEEVWNRYAHVAISLSENKESEYVLNGQDCFTMILNKEDFDKLNVDYVFSQHEITGEWGQLFTNIYNEDGCWIYKVK